MADIQRCNAGLVLVVGIALGGGCKPRPDVERMQRTLDNALATDRSAPLPSAPGVPNAPACTGGVGAPVSALADYTPSLVGWAGTVYWAQGSHLRYAGPGGQGTEEVDAAWSITRLAVSGAGVFAIVQSHRGPARTRLVWREAPGSPWVGSMERDDVLLNDVLATPDGAYVLAGRVLASPGPASQLLHFSNESRTARVVLERERGALFLVGDGTSAYWIEHPHTGRGQSGRSALVRATLAGGEVEVLAQAPGVMSWLTLDEAHVYWVERDDLIEAQGRLMRMPRAGGAARLVHPAVDAADLVVHRGVVLARHGMSTLVRIDPARGEAPVVLRDPRVIARPFVADDVLYWVSAETMKGAYCIRSIPVAELRAE